MDKIEDIPIETEVRVHNAMSEALEIAGPADNDGQIEELFIYDYMKYPNKKKKNKFLGKSSNATKTVQFRKIVTMVTYTNNGQINVQEVALRTEEEQSKSTMKRSNI